MSKEITDFLDAVKAMRDTDFANLKDYLVDRLSRHEDTEAVDVIEGEPNTLGVTFGGSQFFITIEDA